MNHDFKNLTVVDHPLIADKLTRLRSTETPHHEFKMLLDAVSSLLFYEASRNLATQNQRIRTPLEQVEMPRLAGDVLLVPILRAGLAMVNGITLSAEQLEHAKRFETEQTSFELIDYRDASGSYDRIASIEMIEAVGESHWPAYFQTIHDRLAPGGIAAIQAITIDERLFPAYRSRADFIQRHIFPGGMLPTVDLIRRHADAHGLTFETVHRFGHDYARTLRLWRERFDQVTPALEALGFDATFRRKWRLYFCYCEAGFEDGPIDVGIYRLTKPGGEQASGRDTRKCEKGQQE